ELGSTESWRDRWYHLISAVKRRYPGPLVYSANWDHLAQVSFWELLDYFGVSAYHELAAHPGATVDEMALAWGRARDDLISRAQKAQRPLVIVEVGYPSRRGAAVRPWDYTGTAPVDLEEQRRCYLSFVTAWKNESRLSGVFFWEWRGLGGMADGGYT